MTAGTDNYNTGELADRRKALDAILDFTKLIVSLATGTVVLSATFLEKFYNGKLLEVLIASWSALGMSVLIGLVAFGTYISQVAESDLRPRRSSLETWNLAQWALFFAGVVLLAVFVVKNVA